MKKANKIFIGVAVFVIVIGILMAFGQANFLLGAFKPLMRGPFSGKYTPIDISKLFWHKGKVVSVVTSPVTSAVPSVVVSSVTSSGGTSRVASVVVSAVTSAVASAVGTDQKVISGIDTSKLKQLTAKILVDAAKTDYISNRNKYLLKAKEDFALNPSKFALPNAEKLRLIDLYKKKYPSQFTFIKK